MKNIIDGICIVRTGKNNEESAILIIKLCEKCFKRKYYHRHNV